MSRLRVDEILSYIKSLSSAGFEFFVIVDVVFSLYTKSEDEYDDLDLFAIKPNPLIEEEAYESYANRNGFEFERTWAGTPRLVGPEGFSLEFYTNIMEFEMPEQFLNELHKWNIRGVKFESVILEQQVLLKARAAMMAEEHLEELIGVAGSIKRLIRQATLKGHLRYFSEDAVPVMERILKRAGLLT